ncbi:DUF805 domain-containing protein [Sphingosinicella terrae]|jgi:uncharacterized membrane protein YhaH (DUF805 family)|uniref:DUF805 domain-containing protein n=1 Tax=Sphingosinicella terrae TaxID=2172047 RepID=UPI000E0D2E07|nr:DUF805 domain-containing protein [Sphingosinicella terrae]
MEYMFAPLKRYAEFSGRSRRKEYWLWVLFVLVAYFVLMYVDAALGLGGTADSYAEGGSAGFNMSGGWLTMIFALAVFIPGLAVSIRRLHDIGKSGWFVLLAFVPLVNLYLLYLYVQPGTQGPNEYGPDPKGEDAQKVFA